MGEVPYTMNVINVVEDIFVAERRLQWKGSCVVIKSELVDV